MSVPRVFNKFYSLIQANIRAMEGVKGALVRKAVAAKLANLEIDGSYTHKVYDTLVFNKMKDILGGRVQYCLTGSAPCAAEVQKFLKIAFCCPFVEGYGQTEAMAAEFISSVDDIKFGAVGVLPQNEFKLVDVPKMNYFATDVDEEGRPAPRGEIYVRGNNVIPGYYKNDEKTADTFTEDGWLKSGDIGTIMPESHALKITDRVKNIFKLSQGEYVAPDRLEMGYKGAQGVADIYVYGESTKSSLIAVIHAEKADVEKAAEEAGVTGTYEELIENEAVVTQFGKYLETKRCECGFKGFERLAKIKLVGENFESQGLLTTTFKIKREDCRVTFEKILADLYHGID